MSEVREKPLKGRPFSWVEKDASRLLRERMNGASNTAIVLSVYCALCEIASDKNSPRFTTSHPHIWDKAGCGRTSLQDALKEIEGAGLVQIETPKLKGPCTFTLFYANRSTASDGRSTASDGRSTASDGRSTFLASAATVEESVEETDKNTMKTASPPLPFASDAFGKAWGDWREHLEQKRVRTTGKATEAQLAKCLSWGEEAAIAAIRHSISGNYQGLFEPKFNGTPTPKPAVVYDKPAWLLKAEAFIQAWRNGTATPETAIACRDAILAGGREAVNWLNSTLTQEERQCLLTEWNVNAKWEVLP
jgi:hypothetical protein